MKRRLLALFLTLAMLMTMMPVHAENGEIETYANTTTVFVNVQWVDDYDNAYNTRPSTLEFALDTNLSDKLVITEATGWRGSFTNAKPFNEILFENNLEYYTGNYLYAGNTWTFTYTLTKLPPVPEKGQLSVQLHWDDQDNVAGLRPDSITADLMDGWTDLNRPATLSEANGWFYVWDDLELSGNANRYSASVNWDPAKSGYTGKTERSGDEIHVYYSYVPQKMKTMTATIDWDDEEDAYGLRPDSLDVWLYQDGNQFNILNLTAANGWSTTFQVPEDSNSRYFIDLFSTIPAGYLKPTPSYDSNGVVTLLVKRDPDYVLPTKDIHASLTWNDGDGATRPETFTARLLADGVVVKEGVYNAGTTTFGWDAMPAISQNKTINYTLEIDGLSEPYATTVTRDTASNVNAINFNITIDIMRDITLSIDWHDGNNPDRPALDAKIMGGDLNETVKLNSENGWTYTWRVPMYSGTNLLTYAVWPVTGAHDIYSFDPVISNGNHYTVHAYLCDATKVDAKKIWSDDDDRNGLRPTSVQVVLLLNGEEFFYFDNSTHTYYSSVKTLNAANGWSATWDNLPRHRNANYTVMELNVPSGYEPSYRQVGGVWNDWEITNTYIDPPVSPVSLSIKKIWDDQNNQDGKRPNTITVNVVGTIATDDGDKSVYNEKHTLDVTKDTETYTINDLPKFSEGKEITYSVTEDQVDGYTASVTGGNGSFTITNTHTPGTISLSIEKVWDDQNDQDGLRPETITVTVIGVITTDDGAVKTVYEEEHTLTVTKDEETYTFDDLPTHSGGKLITYTVSEKKPDGYDTPDVKDHGDYSFTITNTHTPGTISLSIEKVWDDQNDQDGLRPETITVTVTGVITTDDGTVKTVYEEEHTLTVTKDEETYTFDDLPTHSDGKLITYTVSEKKPDGYDTPDVKDHGDYSFTITNTHTPETCSITVQKVWTNEDKATVARPKSITVNLYANGVPSDSKVMTAEDNWHYTWTNLPVYASGEEITYTVDEEIDPDDCYTATVTKNENGFVITNEYCGPTEIPESPAEPTLEPTEEPTATPVPTEEPTAAPDVTEAPTLAPTEKPTTVPEVTEEPTATLAPTEEPTATPELTEEPTPTLEPTEEPTATLEPTPEVTEAPTATPRVTPVPTEAPVANMITISGQKTWQDNDDTAGLRPREIVVYLLRNGEIIDETKATAEGGWSYSFTNLPDIDEQTGNAYTYTISEQLVSGYYGYASGYDLVNVLVPEKTSVEPRSIPIEELELLVKLYDYETPMYGALLGTGLEVPAYPFVAGAVGMMALLAFVCLSRKRKED